MAGKTRLTAVLFSALGMRGTPMTHERTLIALTIGISSLIKRLDTLERCIDKLCDCVNDLTVCIEAAPLLDAEEVAEAETDLDAACFDRMLGPTKPH